jgi:hypothetical protein
VEKVMVMVMCAIVRVISEQKIRRNYEPEGDHGGWRSEVVVMFAFVPRGQHRKRIISM